MRRGAEPELSASCRTRANRRQTRLHTLTHGTEPARSADERRSRAASCTAAVSVHERWLCLNVRWRFRTVSPRRSHRVPASINSATSAERASWLAVSWSPAQTSRRLCSTCARGRRGGEGRRSLATTPCFRASRSHELEKSRSHKIEAVSDFWASRQNWIVNVVAASRSTPFRRWEREANIVPCRDGCPVQRRARPGAEHWRRISRIRVGTPCGAGSPAGRVGRTSV